MEKTNLQLKFECNFPVWSMSKSSSHIQFWMEYKHYRIDRWIFEELYFFCSSQRYFHKVTMCKAFGPWLISIIVK